MRIIRRALVASAIALPLMVGAAGIASADTPNDNAGASYYTSSSTSAGSGGASTDGTTSWATDDASAYHHGATAAGPDGASSESTHSYSYDGDNHHGWVSYDNDDCDYNYGHHHWNHHSDWNDNDDGGLLDVGSIHLL
ncbi:hypothetical protein FHX82_001691 [Amycolatopsis bartoniae]|uniref:Uncharacterized protein n=1 Tax=Amycolatopsis bartoniae TaxID=941986 RepID=A0A8H9MCN3_9PSEU|nr:hypothetical protein [Amycolatopsis bartoniae]MBB2934671.1 hypothetical protein [Amycolatopsis bartoniae]GHF45656.1 hypothetical protein GCM10017566_18380 [Amycolatopsis bartoniae]